MAAHGFSGSGISDYAARVPRQVPGVGDLHRMVGQLLAERVPEDGQVLVIGAGGGLELAALASARAGWRFCGVDPSADMLALARQTASAHLERIALVEGTAVDAPEGPYDGAVSLLTFHFLTREERAETLQEMRRRLRPRSPLLLAHISFPQTEPERSTWIARHVAYQSPAGMSDAQVAQARETIGSRLTILGPEEEVAMLQSAGFEGASLFYAGLSFRGWVAYAA